MDARIGYPNEHLANTNDENLTSPMYSTGIGLVLKGFEKGNSMRLDQGTNEDEESTKRGKFFDQVLERVKVLFVDEEPDEESDEESNEESDEEKI